MFKPLEGPPESGALYQKGHASSTNLPLDQACRGLEQTSLGEGGDLRITHHQVIEYPDIHKRQR